VYLIGIDESGTGAWAGPFTVTGVAIEVEPFNAWAASENLKDSKKHSDARRRALAPEIRSRVLAHHTEEVPVPQMATGMGGPWRGAVQQVLRSLDHALHALGLEHVPAMIDGNPHVALTRKLERRGRKNVEFEVGADGLYPAVMAASILAKTARNDRMLELDQDYPEYEWAQNSGYGTAKHWAYIQQYGLTTHHRALKKFEGIRHHEAGSWFNESE